MATCPFKGLAGGPLFSQEADSCSSKCPGVSATGQQYGRTAKEVLFPETLKCGSKMM